MVETMQKERYEWIHSWCDESLNRDLPRVLLIGDSITYGYQEFVREKLKGQFYTDYVATSYSIDMKIYRSLILNFVKDSEYDVIHFNHGLHGKYLSKRSYKARVKKLLDALENKNVVLANSTCVFLSGNKTTDLSWEKRVKERNEALLELAEERGWALNDLYSVSVSVPAEFRFHDGTHYLPEGYKMFAERVSDSIKENYCKKMNITLV